MTPTFRGQRPVRLDPIDVRLPVGCRICRLRSRFRRAIDATRQRTCVDNRYPFRRYNCAGRLLTLATNVANQRDAGHRTLRDVVAADKSNGIFADFPVRRRFRPHRPVPPLARYALFGIREFKSGVLVVLRHADAVVGGFGVHPDEHFGRPVVRVQSQDQVPVVFDQAPGAVDEPPCIKSRPGSTASARSPALRGSTSPRARSRSRRSCSCLARAGPGNCERCRCWQPRL